MNISPLTQNNFSAAIQLLRKNALPTEDISETTRLFVLEDGQTIAGTVALEFAGPEGLLRSLSVNEDKRSKGYGKQLVDFIENYARQHGVRTLYLLTTTADKFFIKKGFEIIGRDHVPGYISKTSEFASVCPSSAIVMKKNL